MDYRLEFVVNAFSYCYGALSVLRWLWSALLDGSLLCLRSKEAEKELAAARRRFWDLSTSPLPSFHHAFFTTDAGVKLHYVISSWDPGNNPNLVILLHGFPDSWVLWREFLTRQKLDNETVYVALDLPGFGGSDSLPVYTADHVLETVTAFVLGMRERCIQEEDVDRGQVVIVSHDWGACVASRLASEAPQLADHYILTSAPIMPLAISNITTRLASAQRMIHTWKMEPLRLTLLRNALRTVEPIILQLRKSSYVFAFRLPVPLIRIVGHLRWTTLFGVVHNVASRGLAQSASQEPTYMAEARASSLGPSPAQCVAPPTASSSWSDLKPVSVDAPSLSPSLAYPASVAERARSPTLSWVNQTAYYRDGLATHRWTQSLQTMLSLCALDPTSSVSPQTSHSPLSSSSFLPRALSHTTDTTNGGGSVSSAGSTLRRRRSSAAGTLGALSSGNSKNGTSQNNGHAALDPVRRRSSLSIGSSLFDTAGGGPVGLLRAPVTIVVGAADVAFEWRLVLEGIAEYVGRKGGAVVVLEGAGHCLVQEDVGVKVLGRVVAGVVGADQEEDEGVDDGVGVGVAAVAHDKGERAGVVNGEGECTGAKADADKKNAAVDSGGLKGLLRGLPGVKVVVER